MSENLIAKENTGLSKRDVSSRNKYARLAETETGIVDVDAVNFMMQISSKVKVFGLSILEETVGK